jgi:hypothetical protein
VIPDCPRGERDAGRFERDAVAPCVVTLSLADHRLQAAHPVSNSDM